MPRYAPIQGMPNRLPVETRGALSPDGGLQQTKACGVQPRLLHFVEKFNAISKGSVAGMTL